VRYTVLIFTAIILLGGGLLSCNEKRDIRGEQKEYSLDRTKFRGYLVYDHKQKGRRPGVLIFPEWWGQNKEVRKRADMLAELGYTALVADMYGEGKEADTFDEAAELASSVSKNPELRQQRFMAALEDLKKHKYVDPEKIAAIGYSFGGNIVLQSALDGADIDGVVSFYGGFLVTIPPDASGVKARILVLHGEKDWYVTPQMLAKFKVEMKKSGIHYEFKAYSEANHGYTNPEAEALKEKFKGMHLDYNEAADKQSWEDLQKFLQSVFYDIE
jgi:dienelactone hydrolase